LFVRGVREGAIWGYLDHLYVTLGQFALGVVWARVLGPTDLGTFIAATAFTSLALMVVQFGLPQAVLQARDVGKDALNSAFWSIASLAVLGFGGLWWLADLLSTVYVADSFRPVFLGMSAALLLTPYPAVGFALMRRQMRFAEAAVFNSISFTVSAVAALAALMAGLGVYSLVVSAIVSMLTNTALIAWRLGWVPGFPSLWAVRPLLGYAGFTAINNMIGTSSSRVDNMLVGALLGSAPLGLYNRAYSLARIPSDQFGESIGPLLLGSLARIQDDRTASRRLYFRAVAAIATLTWPFLVVLLLIGPAAITWLYGPDWSGAGTALQAMVVGGFVLVVAQTLRGLLNAQGLVRELVAINLVTLAGTVAVVVGLAPFGIAVIAIGISLREVLVLWMMLRVVRRSRVGITGWEIVGAVWPTAVAALAAASVGGGLLSVVGSEGYLLELLRLVVIGAGVGAAYVLSLIGLRRAFPAHEGLRSSVDLLEDSLRKALGRVVPLEWRGKK
jgi:O-antigen/teichoic acid export membrane protein